MHIESNGARSLNWRGWVALFGFFLGLCSLFTLVVTIGEGWYEYSQSRWMETTARIQECGLENSPGDDKGRVSIACRIGFTVRGEDIVARVSSRSRLGCDEFMQAWLDAHPNGSPITARYNPANSSNVALVTTDAGLWGPHTPENLRMLGVLVVACLLTLAIGRPRPG